MYSNFSNIPRCIVNAHGIVLCDDYCKACTFNSYIAARAGWWDNNVPPACENVTCVTDNVTFDGKCYPWRLYRLKNNPNACVDCLPPVFVKSYDILYDKFMT